MFKKFTIPLIILFLFLFSGHASYASEFSETPTEIIIPSLHLSLPVVAAKITYETWEVNETGASFGVGNILPGLEGNTVIFAHARENLFVTLPDINKGDYVHVFTNKDWFVYQVYETKVVDPNDITVLDSQKAHELTLFTCFGSDYSKRYIVKASMVTNTTVFDPN